MQGRKVHELTWLDALAAHRAPLTVIWGQRDPVSVPKIAEAILERRPDVSLYLFPRLTVIEESLLLIHKSSPFKPKLSEVRTNPSPK